MAPKKWDNTPGSDSDRKAVQKEYSRGLSELNQDAELFAQEFPEGAYGAPLTDDLNQYLTDKQQVESNAQQNPAGNKERARRGAFDKPSDWKREFELGGGRDGG